MPIFTERFLNFNFPDEAVVEKFDGWLFVRNYQRTNQGTKAIDLVALRPDDECCWLIEATDYRIFANQRAIDKVNKPSVLVDEFEKKIKDSLVLLDAAKVSAPQAQQLFAQDVLAKAKKRAVFHIEPHIKTPNLCPAPEHLADIKSALKQRLRDIDRNPIVMSMARPSKQVFWLVTSDEPIEGAQ